MHELVLCRYLTTHFRRDRAFIIYTHFIYLYWRFKGLECRYWNIKLTFQEQKICVVKIYSNITPPTSNELVKCRTSACRFVCYNNGFCDSWNIVVLRCVCMSYICQLHMELTWKVLLDIQLILFTWENDINCNLIIGHNITMCVWNREFTMK